MNSDKLPELPARKESATGSGTGIGTPSSGGPVETLPQAVAIITKDEIGRFNHSKRVGYYLLGRTVGEGAFAKVKEALHFLTGEKVAVKVIDKQKAREDQYVYRNLRREAKLLQMVRHPNIAQLLEVLDTGNNYYLVMELCKGGELMDHILHTNRNGHLDEKETRRLLRQIVSAVDHIHKAGIVHRDLKVENLILDAGCNAKIIDFGLSNIFGSPITADIYVPNEHCQTQCGSPAYAAPELLGRKSYGPEVDVWSIGVVMYAMLTGSLPFTVEPFNITVLHAKMLDNKMNPVPDFISPGCRDLLLKLLNPRPENRITLQEVYRHGWMTTEGADPLVLMPYPNRLGHHELNESILRHMTENMNQCYSEVVAAVTSNRAVKTSAIYFLFTQRLESYEKTRPKTSAAGSIFRRPTREAGDHTKQERSGSTKRRVSERNRPAYDIDDKHLVFPTKDRRRSAPAETVTERLVALGQDPLSRPKSLNTTPKEGARKTSTTSPPRKSSTGTGSFRERSTTGTRHSHPLRRVNTVQGTLAPLDKSPPSSNESPVERKISAPVPGTKHAMPTRGAGSRPRTVSLGDGRATNFMLASTPERDVILESPTATVYHRRSFSDNLPPPIDEGAITVTTAKAYRDKSRSRGSVEKVDLAEPLSQYNPNRIGSATVANRVVKTNPFFTNDSAAAGAAAETLPEIGNSRLGRRNSARRNSTNGLSPTSIKSDLSVDEITTEIMRALCEYSVDDVERKGLNTVVARWNGVIFSCEVVVGMMPGKNVVRFSHLTGGDVQAYNDVCERLRNNLLI